MRCKGKALSVLLVVTLLGCLAMPDGILEYVAGPSDFDGSGDPPSEPVAVLHYLSPPLPRPLGHNRSLLLRAPSRASEQGPGPRILLTRLGNSGSSRWMPGRSPRPRRNTSSMRTPLSPGDPARAV